MKASLATAAAGAVVFAGAATASASGIAPWEVSATSRLASAPDALSPVLWAVMQAGTRAAILVVFVVLLLARRRVEAAATATGAVVAWLLAVAAKEVFQRARPTEALVGIDLREHLASPGFPSSHAAIAAAIAVAAVLTLKPRPVLAVAMLATVVLVAVARVYFGVHWPLDVLGGAALGAGTAGGAAAMLKNGPR